MSVAVSVPRHSLLTCTRIRPMIRATPTTGALDHGPDFRASSATSMGGVEACATLSQRIRRGRPRDAFERLRNSPPLPQPPRLARLWPSTTIAGAKTPPTTFPLANRADMPAMRSRWPSGSRPQRGGGSSPHPRQWSTTCPGPTRLWPTVPSPRPKHASSPKRRRDSRSTSAVSLTKSSKTG